MTLKYTLLCKRIPIARSGSSSKSWRSTVYYDPTTGLYFNDSQEPLSILHKLGDNPANWTYTDTLHRIYSPTNLNDQGEITQGKTPSFFDRFISNSEKHYNNPILGAPARYSYAVRNNADPVTGVVSFMPGVGDAVDLTGAGISALRGNWKDVAVYGTAATLPFVSGKVVREFTSKANKLKDKIFKSGLLDAPNITPQTTSSIDYSDLIRVEAPRTTRDPFEREGNILNRAALAREDLYVRIGSDAAENKRLLDELKMNEAKEAAAKARLDAFDKATRLYVALSDDEVMATYRKLALSGKVTPEYEAILKEGLTRNILDTNGREIPRGNGLKPVDSSTDKSATTTKQDSQLDSRTDKSEETGSETTTDLSKNKTRWQKINDKGTNATRTIGRLFLETKGNNFGNVFGSGYKTRNTLRAITPILIGGKTVGNLLGQPIGGALNNTGGFVGGFVKGYNEGAGTDSTSTKTDTTKVNTQTSTLLPTRYKTLDSLDNAAIEASKQLIDSIYNAN